MNEIHPLRRTRARRIITNFGRHTSIGLYNRTATLTRARVLAIGVSFGVNFSTIGFGRHLFALPTITRNRGALVNAN